LLCDIVVVGGGPAGLSAATWAARHRRSVLVVDNDEPRNRWVDTTHGLLGRDPIAPAQLLRDARDQLGRYPGVGFCVGEATAVHRDERGRFVVRVGNEDRVGLRLILATGVVDRFPEIDGFFEHYGVSAFHCATCDGYEAKGHSLVILGWAEHVPAYALGLLDWARRITIVTEGRAFEGGGRQREMLRRHGIEVVEDDAVALLGSRGRLEGVRLRGGDVIEASYLFFSISHHPRLSLARQLGCEITEDGCLVVDRDGRTSVDGCYGAGDVTPGTQLVAVAAGEGTAAGVACAASLRGEAGAPTSPVPAPDARKERLELEHSPPER
jgi:thioredoxin reductase